jgi:hypothetical protein
MLRNVTRAVALSAALLAAAGCGTNAPDAAAGINSQEAAVQNPGSAQWTPLVEGSDLSQWRGYQREDVPGAWRAENGVLAFQPGGQGGDIITREQFGDFELELEWRISEGGNSGILYRGTEENS